jgi:hypothetical protein
MRYAPAIAVGLFFLVSTGLAELGVFSASLDHPAIEYTKRPMTDRVSELGRQIAEGKVQLEYDSAHGYLRSVLKLLNVPVESQMLVFSKTSRQTYFINPQNPRSLYFNDSVAVGWIPGSGIMEFATQDPRQGAVFYTLTKGPAGKPVFARNDECLSCHVTSLFVPGMLVHSVYPGPDGYPMTRYGVYESDHRSPLEERWGGWYVTGKHGSARHMGNAMLADLKDPKSLITDHGLNVTSLDGRFNTKTYLTPYSDIGALMVFEHQMQMMNLITRVGWEVRVALYQEQMKNSPFVVIVDNRRELPEVLRDTAAELVDYMLFVDEVPLKSRIEGVSGFTEMFSAEGPHDSQGRSLRQLDLVHRVMRYPCSYMIYSDAFNALPVEAKAAIYQRMWSVLSGEDKDSKYARLALADRRAIVEILRDTKKDLPDYFRDVSR